MFKIETGIPKPRQHIRGVRKIFVQMKPGDSILVEMAGKPKAYARKLASRMSVGSPYRFSTRKLDDGNVRIWCEKDDGAAQRGRPRKKTLVPRL